MNKRFVYKYLKKMKEKQTCMQVTKKKMKNNENILYVSKKIKKHIPRKELLKVPRRSFSP